VGNFNALRTIGVV